MSLADDDADDGRTIIRIIEVWECHQQAVAVFQLCPIEGIGHMGGIYWTGIAPEAIRSACLLLRIARTEWPTLGRDVAYMGDCVAAERNRRAAARARR